MYNALDSIYNKFLEGFLLDIVVTLLLVVLPVLILALALFVGRKRNIYQAAVRFGAVLLSTLAGLLTVNLLRSTVLSLCDTIVSGMLPEDFSTYVHDSSSFHDLLSIVSSIAMPLLFMVAFLLFFLIFGVTAVIVSSKALSDEAFARRKAAKQVKNDDEQEPASVEPIKNADWKPIALRVASLLITAVSVFSILSMLASPLTVYAGLIDENSETLHTLMGESADEEGMKTLFDIASDINANPINRMYDSINGLAAHGYATYKTAAGSTVNSFNAISSLLHVAETVITIDFENLSGKDISSLAAKLGGNTFIREFADSLLSDAAKAWTEGNTFIGTEAPVIGDKETTDSLLSVLQTNSGVSALQTVGNAVAVVETIAKDEPGAKEELGESLYTLLSKADDTSSIVIKKMVDTALADTITQRLPMKIDILSTVVETAVEIQQDTGISAEDKDALIKGASSSLSAITEMVKNPEQIDPKELINTIAKSELLVNAIIIETNNGALNNVLDIADILPKNAEKEVAAALEEVGFKEDSVEYKSIMAAISKAN